MRQQTDVGETLAYLPRAPWSEDRAIAGVVTCGDVRRLTEAIEALGKERDQLRAALQGVMDVMPVAPEETRNIVGMQERYDRAVAFARKLLQEGAGDDR